jgi:hypothetical protein
MEARITKEEQGIIFILHMTLPLTTNSLRTKALLFYVEKFVYFTWLPVTNFYEMLKNNTETEVFSAIMLTLSYEIGPT